MLYATRGLLAVARGRHAEAAAAYRNAERMERLLVMPHMFTARVQALKLRMLVRVGETEQVERALAEMDEEVRETSQMRVVRQPPTRASATRCRRCRDAALQSSLPSLKYACEICYTVKSGNLDLRSRGDGVE